MFQYQSHSLVHRARVHLGYPLIIGSAADAVFLHRISRPLVSIVILDRNLDAHTVAMLIVHVRHRAPRDLQFFPPLLIHAMLDLAHLNVGLRKLA